MSSPRDNAKVNRSANDASNEVVYDKDAVDERE